MKKGKRMGEGDEGGMNQDGGFGAFYLAKLKAEIDRKREGRRTEGLERAIRTGNIRGLSWSELNAYCLWIGMEKKDMRVSMRISGTDVMKLKYVARMKGMRYQSYIRDIIKRHIRIEEERMARPRNQRIRLGKGRGGAGAPA